MEADQLAEVGRYGHIPIQRMCPPMGRRWLRFGRPWVVSRVRQAFLRFLFLPVACPLLERDWLAAFELIRMPHLRKRLTAVFLG